MRPVRVRGKKRSTIIFGFCLCFAWALSSTALAPAEEPPASRDYYLPQVANGQFGGGSYRTTFVLFNTSAASASVSIALTHDDGGPLRVTVPDLGTSDQFSLTLEAG